MEIIQKNNKIDGVFQAIDEGNIAGEMFYIWSGDDKIIIEHTEVDEAYGGQGIGKKLVLKSVDFARENKIKIEAECSFAQKVFDKTDDIKDVL